MEGGGRAEKTVGRFAPTPSGRMHLGNVFSLLMAWLAARSAGGRVVLRMEDVDPRAQDRRVADVLMGDLDWLGLGWDEGPWWQSERLDVYEEAFRRLAASGVLYPCFCTRGQLHAATAPHRDDGTFVYPGTCRGLSPEEVARRSRVRPPAWRLRVPDAPDPAGTVAFDDLVCGPRREVLATECGDFVVRRSDGVFAYQLVVAVDDALMGVTQVVRGHDLLGSAARQIYVQRLLGLPSPAFAHVPLLQDASGRRLSKRDRDLDLGALREAGVTPGRLLGALAALAGMALEGEELSADELVGRFSWDALRALPPALTIDGGHFLRRGV